ncbi:MAG TPA: hypothetical protein VF331_00080 [Polyangiales bacterium]
MPGKSFNRVRTGCSTMSRDSWLLLAVGAVVLAAALLVFALMR